MLQSGKENVGFAVNLFANSIYKAGFSYDVVKKWIDGNIFHLVTAEVLIYSFKFL